MTRPPDAEEEILAEIGSTFGSDGTAAPSVLIQASGVPALGHCQRCQRSPE